MYGKSNGTQPHRDIFHHHQNSVLRVASIIIDPINDAYRLDSSIETLKRTYAAPIFNVDADETTRFKTTAVE